MIVTISITGDSHKTYLGKIHIPNCGDFDYISGPWGKGHLDKGEYRISGISRQTKEPFCLFGFGWFALLEPQFKTDRTEIGIHPDGNVRGTQGCIGLTLWNLVDNIKIYTKLEQTLRNEEILVKVG